MRSAWTYRIFLDGAEGRRRGVVGTSGAGSGGVLQGDTENVRDRSNDVCIRGVCKSVLDTILHSVISAKKLRLEMVAK